MPKRFRHTTIAAWLTLITCLIIITPLCGRLFHCHCGWPWLGFYFGCNYYQPEIIHKCSWCHSLFSGLLSIGLASVSALLIVFYMIVSPMVTTTKNIVVSFLAGVTVFILVAILCGMTAAYAQNYPLGIWNVLIQKRIVFTILQSFVLEHDIAVCSTRHE